MTMDPNNEVEIENSTNPDFIYSPGGWAAVEPRPDQIITKQPSNSLSSTAIPHLNDIIPPGLEVLSKLNYIIVNQQMELLYGINGCQTKNQARIMYK